MAFNHVAVGSSPTRDILLVESVFGVTLSNYSPVAAKPNDYMKLKTSVFGMPLMWRIVSLSVWLVLGTPWPGHCKELLDITLVGRCSEAGVNVFRRYGDVWCPWEVGLSKDGRAGSNPVTSDFNSIIRFFVNLTFFFVINYKTYLKRKLKWDKWTRTLVRRWQDGDGSEDVISIEMGNLFTIGSIRLRSYMYII
jgi:hypothetical protein